jgi:hypothetical protein
VQSPAPARDGSHDFDFLVDNWKAHVHRLPDRLVGSNNWIEYSGISNHKKPLDSNANFEKFGVDNPGEHLHIKAQALTLYNPNTRQRSIDLGKGLLSVPPVVGEFKYKGWAILVRCVWLNISHRNRRAWNSPSPLTVGKRGKQTGSVN